MESAEVVTIHHVDDAFLAAGDQVACLRNQDRPRRAEIEVAAIDQRSPVRCEKAGTKDPECVRFAANRPGGAARRALLRHADARRYATAHHWYGEYIGLMGKFDEGLAELERAHQLDPLSITISTDTCKVLYHARRYDQAIDQCLKSLKMDPAFALAWGWLGSAYRENGMIDEAVAALEKGDELEKRPPGLREGVIIRAESRNRAEAVQLLEQLEQAWKQGSIPAYQVAYHYAILGDRDRAFDWLEKGIEERSTWVVGFATIPFLGPIRSDSRYPALLKRLALDGT